MGETRKSADVVVIGSGPGGATVARELAQAGKRVVLLEKGRDHRLIGNHLSALMYADRFGLSFTEEGLNLVRAHITGGSTIVYCGSAASPPAWLRTKYGVDLEPYAKQAAAELHLEPLPDDVLGAASLRMLNAANTLGYKFEKMPKFIDPSKCKRRCGGTCMLGCPHGAKWTARRFIDDMKAAGGELITQADVQTVTIEDGVAAGVSAITPKGLLHIDAPTVVVSAGGLGTPCILQRSGIHEAGAGMFLDPLVFVTGVAKGEGTALGPPMAIATYEMLDEGILLSDLIDPWGMWLLMTARSRPSRLPDGLRYRSQLGLMVKIGDDRTGHISMNGRVSKPLSVSDRQKLSRGAAIARRILIEAGCDPASIVVGPVRGAHPGATARIGEVVDTNLQTRVPGLYVSDASVLPEALDRPLVLAIISLARRLSDHLLGRDSVAQSAAAAS